jgi:hypothetical protein
LALRDSLAEAYLKGRSIDVKVFGSVHLPLRCHPHLPFYQAGADGRAQRLHVGPALLAPMIRPDGRFGGVHRTWIDPDRPGEKAVICDSSGAQLSAKKMLGEKKACYIPLIEPEKPRRLICGEGNETSLSVALALKLSGQWRDDDAVRAAGDLGNLGGPACEAIAHPDQRNAQGGPLRVPGPEPDLTQRAMAIPESVEELIFLGDGDCDPFIVEMSLARAARRYHRPGRIIRAARALSGFDFNDLLRQAQWRRAA